MNAPKCLALVMVALLAWQVGTLGATETRKPRKKAAEAPAAVVPMPEVVVDGYGETPDKARDLALDRACKRVEQLLQERIGGAGWMPTREYLDPEFLALYKVLQPRGEPESATIQGENLVVARYTVQLTPQYLRKLADAAREQKVEERHLLFARVLAAILTLALVVAGYLRFDEWTRGYATRLLRLAAVIILAIVGLGLLVMG